MTGIDTDALTPPEDRPYEREIVTYVSRNLEPYRGFHCFMRALPEVLRARPKAQVHIVGGDRVTYGNPPLDHANWREAMLSEVGSKIDLTHVHFTGHLNYNAYLKLMRQSTVHVYLTYPFVLSWDLEAMALGCHVIGSETPPVQELIEDGFNGHARSVRGTARARLKDNQGARRTAPVRCDLGMRQDKRLSSDMISSALCCRHILN